MHRVFIMLAVALCAADSANAGTIRFLSQPNYQGASSSPLKFDNGKSYLEDFESGSVTSPGLNVSTGVHVKGASPAFHGPSSSPSGVSVDEGGFSVAPIFQEFDFVLPQSFWSGLWLDFDSSATGYLPTSVGFVLTDIVASTTELRVRAYDGSDNLIDELVESVGTSDGMFFVGMDSAQGIASVSVSSWTLSDSSWFQLDHVQYGRSVPEPSGAILLAIGALVLLLLGRR